MRAMDTWKCMKNVTIKEKMSTNEANQQTTQETDLKDIKAQVANLTGLIHGLANQKQPPTSYADAAKQGTCMNNVSNLAQPE